MAAHSIEPGSTFGACKVTAALGAGGTGEVWRAVDTRLGREVALTRVPNELATDPERMTRFEREARVPASLDHPSIATLHGLESAHEQGIVDRDLEPANIDLRPDGDIMSAAIATADEAVTIGSPERLFETQDTGPSYPSSPTPGGGRFVPMAPQSGPRSLSVVLGWTSELEGDRRR